MKFCDNLKLLRTNNNLTMSQLASEIGVSRSLISKYEKGEREPGREILMLLSKRFNVTVDFLIGAEKDIIRTRIPVIGTSAGGIPVEAIQEYIDDTDPDTWEEITEQQAASGSFVAVKIKGDSMAPRIMDGDTVIVRLQNDLENGETGIIMVNGNEATCKKIKKRPEGVILIPNNPAYEPMFYSNDDIKNLPVKIYGKVIEVRGKL